MAQSRGLTGINAPAWWHNLILNKDGHPARGKLENVAIPFEQDPDFQDKFWFDVFQMKILVNGALPWRPYPPRGLWELQKGDELEAWRWLEQQGIPTSHQLTLHGIAAAAYKHQFNPVLDYLNSLVWDGVPRLDTWAIDYLGAADTKYVRAVSAKWMIAAIARVEDPGCQADNALVLEGEQGHVRRGKSSALNVLGQPWYTDQLDADLSHKDASEQVVGVWIVELGELEAMIRSSPAAIKAFITRRKGRFRWSYDPAIREYPRQCVFAGTVNDQSWNRDPTGNRRFWPIWCTIIDVPGLELARDQLWAEAHHRYVRGEKHLLDEPALVVEAREEQELRYLQDPWEETIAKFLRAWPEMN